MRVLMLLSNPFKPDPRVYEEAKALTQHGHKVTILAWDRELKYPADEQYDGIRIIRVAVPGGYGKLAEFLPGLIKFYIRAGKISKRLKFDVVHAHDFDTLPLGIRISRGKKLVYDMHDDYASMIQDSVPHAVGVVVDIIQRVLARFADAVVYANDALQNILKIPGTVVMNCKDPEDYVKVEPVSKEELGLKGFTVVYIGIFRQIKFLESLIQAVKMAGVNLVLGGDGPYKERIMNLIKGAQNIKYVGWVSAKDIPRYTLMADVIVVLNDPCKRYDRVSTPVKMFEAMAAGVPVIVSKGGEAEKIVNECGCGLAVPFG
ncbi:MAG: glycosyltransferase family 4 protein, partial [Euryarchaeota archaeon]|nr:glycosyltransferase family 4 protein [Euryarchaeota archaeon]